MNITFHTGFIVFIKRCSLHGRRVPCRERFHRYFNLLAAMLHVMVVVDVLTTAQGTLRHSVEVRDISR